MTDKKFVLKDRSIELTIQAPLAHIREMLELPPAQAGKAFVDYFSTLKNVQPSLNDIEHLKALINWYPENTGLTPMEMLKRLPIASKILKAEKQNGKERYILLSEKDVQIIKSILNNKDLHLKPSMAFYGFLEDLQETLGIELFEEEK